MKVLDKNFDIILWNKNTEAKYIGVVIIKHSVKHINSAFLTVQPHIRSMDKAFLLFEMIYLYSIEKFIAENSINREEVWLVVNEDDANSKVNDDSQLPQTGYSNFYKVIAGLAALMTVSGAALVVKTRKENE